MLLKNSLRTALHVSGTNVESCSCCGLRSEKKGYALGMARSRNGDIQGPWGAPFKTTFARNGGHGMLFRTLNGQLMLTLHQPNEWPDERAQLFLIEEDDQGIPFVTTRLTPADAIKGANDIE